MSDMAGQAARMRGRTQRELLRYKADDCGFFADLRSFGWAKPNFSEKQLDKVRGSRSKF
jgi:hypothetical protein